MELSLSVPLGVEPLLAVWDLAVECVDHLAFVLKLIKESPQGARYKDT